MLQAQLGAKLSETEARLFAFACRQGGASLTDAKAVTGQAGPEARKVLNTLAVQRLLRYVTRITTASSSRAPAGVEADQGQVRRPIDHHFFSGWFSPEFNHDPFRPRGVLELPPEDARPAPRLRCHRSVVRLHGSEPPRRSPQEYYLRNRRTYGSRMVLPSSRNVMTPLHGSRH